MDIDIDTPSHLRNKNFNTLKNYFESIGGTAVRVATFKTETSKSACKTACKGLKINNDISAYLSNLIPVERGSVRPLHDVYYGNKDEGIEPIKEFVNIVDSYDGLLKAMLDIEGLISGISSHASGVLCLNKPLEDTSSYMRTPSGELVTSFDLHEEEQTGVIKYDLLVTKAASHIQTTMKMLVDANYIPWEGSLRATYDKHLSPEVIDIENEEMWKLIRDGRVLNLFQFETIVGINCINKLQPKNLIDLANANSLMRLSSKDELQPLDKYILFRDNPHLWEEEMINYGLTEEERLIMHEELDNQCGVCSNQESLMELFMNPKITNMTVGEVNQIRKAVAKKDAEAREIAKELVFRKGKELGTSETLLNYCWYVQAAYQFGYAFSIPHCIAYSLVGLQEAYLMTKFPKLYWYCANLLCMADSLEADEDINEFTAAKDKTMDYGKVAKAVYKIMDEGVNIELPDINRSSLEFLVDEGSNSIMFGLKGISGINEKACNDIINNRPYSSLLDFHEKMVETKEEYTKKDGTIAKRSIIPVGKVVTLIKAGCFDSIEGKDRETILMDYLRFLFPNKKSLSVQNINSIIEYGIVDEDHRDYVRFYNFRKYLLTKPFTNEKGDNGKVKNIKWYKLTGDEDEKEYSLNFLEEFFLDDMKEDVGYRYNNKGELEIALGTSRKFSFEDVYNSYMNKFKEWLNSDDCLGIYNDLQFKKETSKYTEGNVSSWEMESISMYYSGHELENINFNNYSIVDFNSLPTQTEIVGYNNYKGVKYPKYKLSRIVGTVLSKNANKHIVSILTPTGVVDVKMYSGQFTHYNKAISYIGEDGKKVTVESSWFEKGTKLLITGYRQENLFRSKTYKDDVFSHTIQKINGINDKNNLILQEERARV